MASAGKHGGPTTESPLLANQPKDTINLAVGHPMQSELPNKIISDAMKRCGSKLKHNQLGYDLDTSQKDQLEPWKSCVRS